jgi:hypothetical protein
MEAEIIKYGFQFGGICGGVVASLFLLYKSIADKKTSKLDKERGYKGSMSVIVLSFILSFASVWMYSPASGNDNAASKASLYHIETPENVCKGDEQTLCIEGFGLPMQKFKPNSPAGDASAQEAAELDADSKFLKKIAGHDVESSEGAKDFSMENKSITSWSKNKIRSGETVQVKRNVDGSCKVVVRYKRK